MKFKKHGVVFTPGKRINRAYYPTPVVMGNCIRLFFSGYIQDNYIPCYIDLCKEFIEPIDKVELVDLALAQPGGFDYHGVVLSSFVKALDKTWYAYYIGWQHQLGTLPRLLFSGLATTSNLKTFKREIKTPVLDRWHKEPHLRSAPFVMCDGGEFKVFYAGSGQLDRFGITHVPRYYIATADSGCGFKFETDTVRTVLRPKACEQGLTRPWIITPPGIDKWYMFYSARVKATGDYRVGYATSTDLYKWTRRGEIPGFPDTSASYFSVVKSNDRWIGFYNTAGYGKDGIHYGELFF